MAKFKLFYWYVNPLHAVYELHDCSRDQLIEMDPSEVLQMDSTDVDNYAETDIRSSQKDHDFRSIMYYLFESSVKESQPFMDEPPSSFPVALITLVLSFFICTDPSLRLKFTSAFSGRIPYITEFLLKNLSVGQVSPNAFVEQTRLDIVYMNTRFFVAVGGSPFDNEWCKKFFTKMLIWFQMLDKFGGEYLKLVAFEKQPIVSDNHALPVMTICDKKIYYLKDSMIDKLNDYDRQIIFLIGILVNGQLYFNQDLQIGTHQQNCVEYNCDLEQLVDYVIELVVFGKCHNLQLNITNSIT